jgi:hypothetical protein
LLVDSGAIFVTAVIDAPAQARVGQDSKYFYFYMALSCAAVAFLGFAPTYWLPIAGKSFKANPIIHVHGLVFFSWTLYFSFQTWLAASGRVARHRAIGLVGISFATAMTIFGFLATVNSMKTAESLGLKDAGIAFAIVPFSDILFFAVVVALAVGTVRQPETHKRLMLLAAISILDAAVGRWFLTFLAPPGPPGPPPVIVTIPAALVAYLLLVVVMIFDWRTQGRPHRVYVIGGATLVAVKLLALPISATSFWHSFAGGILALAQ